MGIDAVIAIVGLLAPPIVDFVKKKWLKPGQDSPEATMSSLATTKPEVLPQYIEALSKYMEAQVKYFNRDVSGNLSQLVLDIRAGIRPFGVIGAMLILGGMVLGSLLEWKPDPSMADTIVGVRLSCELIISSWFGDRISIGR